jgi:acetyltransferase-like isoleucine patch superfamily enzyme
MKINPKGIYELEPGRLNQLDLITPYDLTIQFSSGMQIEIGRFSHGLLRRCRVLTNSLETRPLRIGAFCESAEGVTIVVGGDHRNESIWNYTCGAGARPFYDLMEREERLLTQCRPARPITIGDNVIISSGSTIVGGAYIGTGSVIAAGALVNKGCSPFGIYAGVPARRVKDRFGEDRVALHQVANFAKLHSHHVPRLPRLLRDLELGVITPEQYSSSISFMEHRPRLILQATVKEGVIHFTAGAGYALGDNPISDGETIAQLDYYFAQFWNPPERVNWTPDIFHTLGLC